MKKSIRPKKKKELLKQNIADIEDKLSFDNPKKESLSAITNEYYRPILADKIDKRNHQLSLKTGEILSFVTKQSFLIIL